MQQHLQPQGAEVRWLRQPVQGRVTARFAAPRVEGHLQVDVLERRQVAADHRVGQPVRSQPVADEPDHFVAAVAEGVRLVDPLEHRAERRRELPCLALAGRHPASSRRAQASRSGVRGQAGCGCPAVPRARGARAATAPG